MTMCISLRYIVKMGLNNVIHFQTTSSGFPKNMSSICFCPNQSKVAIGTKDGRVKMYVKV
jgi:hypothetical protein